jgi:hypothetical protein
MPRNSLRNLYKVIKYVQSQRVLASFQAVVATYMRSTLFWDIVQRILVLPYRRFGTTYRFHLQGVKKTYDSGRWASSLSRNVGTAADYPTRVQISEPVLLQHSDVGCVGNTLSGCYVSFGFDVYLLHVTEHSSTADGTADICKLGF